MVYKKESLIKRIEKLKEYGHDIKEIKDISFEEYLKDKKIKYSTERLLFLICENILDFLDHILSSRFEVVSDSYEEIIDNSYKKGLIDNTIYGKLKGIGGFRNVLAHEYFSISDDEIYKNLKKMVEIIDEIVEAFEKIIK